MSQSDSVPMEVLLSDRVLDGVLSFLLVRATAPGGDTSVENLARRDLKAALMEVLGRRSVGPVTPVSWRVTEQ